MYKYTKKTFPFIKVPGFGWHRKQYQSCGRKELVLMNWISILCFSFHSPAEASQCFVLAFPFKHLFFLLQWNFSETCGGLSRRIHPQVHILIIFWIRLACVLLVTNHPATQSVEQSTWLPCCFVCTGQWGVNPYWVKTQEVACAWVWFECVRRSLW